VKQLGHLFRVPINGSIRIEPLQRLSPVMKFDLRTATESDIRAIESLITDSARRLGARCYSSEQIEEALKAAWGVDTQLIVDQTYFVVESDGLIVGCGGWSYRETLFGNDTEHNRRSNLINPQTGRAKIRAYFVSPDYARRGIGTMIYMKCEEEARRHGFEKFELMATLPGVTFYEFHGFIAGEPISYKLKKKLSIEFVPMKKDE